MVALTSSNHACNRIPTTTTTQWHSSLQLDNMFNYAMLFWIAVMLLLLCWLLQCRWCSCCCCCCLLCSFCSLSACYSMCTFFCPSDTVFLSLSLYLFVVRSSLLLFCLHVASTKRSSQHSAHCGKIWPWEFYVKFQHFLRCCGTGKQQLPASHENSQCTQQQTRPKWTQNDSFSLTEYIGFFFVVFGCCLLVHSLLCTMPHIYNFYRHSFVPPFFLLLLLLSGSTDWLTACVLWWLSSSVSLSVSTTSHPSTQQTVQWTWAPPSVHTSQ